MNKIRCAVIGVGYLGKFHAQKYAALDNAELIAVCDTDPVLCDKIATEHGIPAMINYQELFGKVDAVSIAVPTTQHYEVAKACLQQGIHVLVEKPITTTVTQAQTLIDCAKTNKLVLQVGHLERFNSARIALEKYLDTPRFIESYRIAPYHIRGTDVDVILDLMIHDIDIIQSIVKSPIHTIDAQGTPILSKSIDIANARLNFENGCVANVTASRISFKTARNTRIFQQNSYLSIDYQHKKIHIFHKDKEEMLSGIANINREEFTFEAGDALNMQIESFLQVIASGEKPLVSGEDGCNALKTAIWITQSIKQHLEKFNA